MSTFHGLEMAKQALFAQQMGLYTTGHNISNVNTDGYSRQRVNFETMNPYPAASRNRPQIPGQIGTGVQAGTVQRLRDAFLDYQYRTQNSTSSYWGTRADALSRMESLMNEMDDTDGLNKTLDDFWKALQALSTNPRNTGAREVVAQKGQAVADTFNHLATSLEAVRTDLKSQIGDAESGKIGDANSLLRQINALNKQIGELEPHGYLPNDLYDRRDKLIDELSGIVNIKVSYEKSADSSLAIADGIAEIELVDAEGKELGVKILSADDRNKRDDEIGQFGVAFGDDDVQNAVTEITFGGQPIEFMKVAGSLKGLVESYGYVSEGDTEVKGDYPDMLADLDEMAGKFAEKFNSVHRAGYDLKDKEQKSQNDFFSTKDGSNKINAKNITVNPNILEEPSLIAISENGDSGNAENALDLAKVITEDKVIDANTTLKGFYQKMTSKLAVKTQEANRRVANNAVQQQKIQNDRLSVSAVSLDEEMTNLLKFQHAYNAAARSMTAMDELLDKIINSMGLVGR